MLTFAPLPTWRNLIRALRRRASLDAGAAAVWCRDGEIPGWLSRSAWSLALIALWRRKRAPDSPLTVWVPGFFCNTSLAPLRAAGADLMFYPLTDELVPDIAACRADLEAKPPDLFLMVSYFGQPASAAATREICARKGAWLIEDAAHVLRPTDDIGTHGDFVLYSPHKHLPIPYGALLIVRSKGPSRFRPEDVAAFGAPNSWAGQLRDLQQSLGCSTFGSRWREAVWWAKRLLQRLGVSQGRGSMPQYSESTAPALAATVALEVPSLSALAKRLLVGSQTDLQAVAQRRRRNQLMWDTLLLGDDAADAEIAPAARPKGLGGWTPYLAAYRTDPSVSEATYRLWRQKGLPVTTWPDLPPEVIAGRVSHPGAWRLRHGRIYLPVHQSLNARLMVKHRGAPNPSVAGVRRVDLVWGRATRAQWQAWEAGADRSSLLQNWAYGAAKSETSGWRVKRGVFYVENEPVALVQVLQKRIAGLLQVTRINRGPLCLRELLPREQLGVWQELAHLGSIGRGRVLAIAPDIELSGPALVMFAELGFRQFSPRAWESVRIELGLELGVLRGRLDGKWRNMLAFSERAALTLEQRSDADAFDWMVARYQELMRAKNFTGPSISFLAALRKNFDDESPLLVLRAMADGVAVAAICLALHGATATYLLAWNSDQGRALKANQYLLWHAIIHLKQCGLRWLDLGGISEEHTPGVTAFKLGLNGERYELVGEYWKW